MLYKCLNIKNGITRIRTLMIFRDFNGTAVTDTLFLNYGEPIRLAIIKK